MTDATEVDTALTDTALTVGQVAEAPAGVSYETEGESAGRSRRTAVR